MRRGARIAAALLRGAAAGLALTAGANGVIGLGTAPALAAVKAAPAETGAKNVVPVRVGRHEGFNRVVFDWPLAIDYGVLRKGRTITIRFRRAARIDMTRLSRSASPLIVGAEVDEGPNWTLVKFKVAEGVRIRHFRFGSGVVLDLLEPRRTAADASGKKPEAAQPTGENAAKKPPQNAKLTPKPQRSRALVGNAGTPAGNKRVTAARKNSRVLSAPRKRARSAVSEPRRLSTNGKHRTQGPVSKIPVSLSLQAKAAVLRFHWEAPVGAAVFMRGGYLWVVFDREAGMAFDGWPKKDRKRSKWPKRRRAAIPLWAKRLGKAKASRMPGSSIFRMSVPTGIFPRVTKEGLTWVVTLDEQITTPVAGIPIEPYFAPAGGARLHLAVNDAGAAVAIPDPAAGDRVWVIPVTKSGKGIGVGRSFAEVELLATAQGIAGRALSDAVKFQTQRQGVEITAPGGLRLSGTNVPGALAPAARGKQTRGAIAGQSWLFEFEKLYQIDGDAFAAMKHKFLEAAYKAQPTEQGRARLRLAQLHFANSRYADVIGILRVIEADEPTFVNDPVFRALRGASYFSLADLKRARRDLFHNSLDPYNEISLWRGAVDAVDGKWVKALRHFSRSDYIIRSYPRRLRIDLGLLAAETAWQGGDVVLTKYHLATVDALKPGRSFAPRLQFLRGHLLAKTLYPEDAVEYWNRAMEGADPKIRVRAALAKTEILLKHGKIDLKKAAEELEKLRYVWRGDRLEFEVLTRLGRAYLDTGDFKNGLLTLRDAARYYPKFPETDGVVKRMRKAFVKLYVGGRADKLPPLVSLALYDEFRELTPPGKVGNDLIAKLARRLVGVDLLDRSAILLKHLVDERLTGTERLEAANQLGLVYLLDRKPDQALATLSGELPADIAPKVTLSRRLLRARALGELARYKEALTLLKSDKSRDAELLRAEIYWRLKTWGEAAKAYGSLVDIDGSKQIGFSDTRQRYVLNLVISLALSEDARGLDSVRKRFAARMAKTRYRDAFNLVSGHSGPVPSSYWLITQKVAEVDLFRTFMKSYREKLLPAPGKPKRRAANVAVAPSSG